MEFVEIQRSVDIMVLWFCKKNHINEFDRKYIKSMMF